MSNDHSIIIVAPDAHKSGVDAIVSAIFGDAPGSPQLTYPLSPDGSVPATAWANHVMRGGADAAVLAALPTNGGTLPAGIDWSVYGMTTQEATDAAAAVLRVSVKTGAVEPIDHLGDVKSDLGMQTAIPAGPP